LVFANRFAQFVDRHLGEIWFSGALHVQAQSGKKVVKKA
jgi:hypothetical protein